MAKPKSEHDIRDYELTVVRIMYDRILLEAMSGNVHVCFFEIFAESAGGDYPSFIQVNELVPTESSQGPNSGS